jgi:curved DNA-binding protein CbpA
MGSYTYDNAFKGELFNNTWGNWFYSNTIGFDFGNNNIIDFFNSNIIADSFQNNDIMNGFSDNVIGDGFGFGNSDPQGNKIGNNFRDNKIYEYFYNNTIADNFENNSIGNNFQWNIINTNINNTNFTNYGNIIGFTPTANGGDAEDNTYTNVSSTTNGFGVGATFDIYVENGSVLTVNINDSGRFYVTGDTLTILGEQINGITPDDNIVITVTGVSVKPSVYEPYTCQIFEKQGGNKRLSFYDENDILTITNINE